MKVDIGISKTIRTAHKKRTLVVHVLRFCDFPEAKQLSRIKPREIMDRVEEHRPGWMVAWWAPSRMNVSFNDMPAIQEGKQYEHGG